MLAEPIEDDASRELVRLSDGNVFHRDRVGRCSGTRERSARTVTLNDVSEAGGDEIIAILFVQVAAAVAAIEHNIAGGCVNARERHAVGGLASTLKRSIFVFRK